MINFDEYTNEKKDKKKKKQSIIQSGLTFLIIHTEYLL